MNDKEQTQTLDALRERLQSIAIMAVGAQNVLGNSDLVADYLMDIERDLEAAYKYNSELQKTWD